MSGCTEKRFGEMLYPYELGMLSKSDELELDLHFYNCVHCFENAKQFKDEAWLLRHSKRVHNQIEQDAKPKSMTSVTRLLLIAAVVIVMAVPVYHIAFYEKDESIQQIYLVPFRESAPAVINNEQGGKAEIRFVVEEAKPENIYNLSITARNGDMIYSEDNYADFNKSGQGLIVLPVDIFDKGFYVLTVSIPHDDSTSTVAQYPFRVK